MTDAGGITIGGLLVASGWAGGWLLAKLAQIVADEIRCFVRIRGDRPAACAADDHAADRAAPRLWAVTRGSVTHWFVMPSDQFRIGGVDRHDAGFDPETIRATSGNLHVFTGVPAHG